MNQLKRIIVGSLNPVKVQAALAGFSRMFPSLEFEAKGVSVPSGVSDQPMSCEETLRGATNRASELKRLTGGDFMVGIEGGIELIEETYFASAWVVIMEGPGEKIARGRSGSFALPPRIKQLVESGMELGHANDEVFGELNSKQSGGAVGSLSAGVITRQLLYEHAMALALIGFRQPDLYW